MIYRKAIEEDFLQLAELRWKHEEEEMYLQLSFIWRKIKWVKLMSY